ncbi:MAG: PQQ-binding-like beta-propeller repeat protein [Verrucomicrobiota bacterium]
MIKTVLNLVAVGFLIANPRADDWPQWQGPQRNAISKETGLLKEWPKDGPPLAWKINGLGGGDSAPSIAAGRIYGMSNRGEDEVVWARSEKDGSEIWVSHLGPAYEQKGWPQAKEGPGCTPTVDGDRLYVIGMAGDISCLQISDGKILWQKSMTRDFGGRVPTWSYRESPLVDGDKVICTPGAQDAMLVALDKLTGNTIWKSQLPASPSSETSAPAPGGAGGSPGGRGRFGGRGGGSGAAYASSIAIEFEGERQYVQLTAKGLIGVAASDGKFLWRYDRPANGMGINCSTPLYHDGRVFAASAYGAGGGLVKLSKDANGGIQAEEVWFSKNMENHHGGVVLVDGCLFGANGGNAGGYPASLDYQTGDVLWNERDLDKRRLKKGSVAVADGRIYYRTEEGALVLIEPSRKEYLERGRFDQPDRTNLPAWAHPVIANGKLYIRDQDALFCYDIKAK